MPRLIDLRSIALLTALLPFLLLSAVPAGMMPAKTGSGTLTLVLCTAEGPEEMAVELGSDTPEAASQGCPWALSQAALAVPEAVTPDAPITILPREACRARRADLVPATVPGPCAARAPPTLT